MCAALIVCFQKNKTNQNESIKRAVKCGGGSFVILTCLGRWPVGQKVLCSRRGGSILDIWWQSSTMTRNIINPPQNGFTKTKPPPSEVAHSEPRMTWPAVHYRYLCELEQVWIEKWSEIPARRYSGLIQNLSKSVLKVVAAEGGGTSSKKCSKTKELSSCFQLKRTSTKHIWCKTYF